MFKGAHEAICYGPAEQPWKPDETRFSHVVFIGRGLDKEVSERACAVYCGAVAGLRRWRAVRPRGEYWVLERSSEGSGLGLCMPRSTSYAYLSLTM